VKGRKVLLLLKIAFSAALLYYVVSRIGLAAVAGSIRTITWHFGLAVLYSLLFTWVKAWKWHKLVRAAAGNGATFWEATTSYLVGMAGGLMTPGRVGELARGLVLKKQGKGLVSYLVIVDRIFELTAVLVLALPGLFHFASVAAAVAAGMLLALLLTIVFFPDYPLRWLQLILERAARLPAAREKLASMEMQIAAVPIAVKFKQLGLSFLGYGFVLIQFYHLLNNYHPSRLWTVWLTQPLIMLTNVLPFTIGGLGIREGTAWILLAPFGVPEAAAITSAFMLFLLNTALPGVVGAFLFILLHDEEPAAPAQGSG
jgi:uncharacterized membrane protein YbhN (UPF0104 family)